jgi:hypothetical protein
MRSGKAAQGRITDRNPGVERVLWSLEGRLRDEVDAVSTNKQVKDQVGRHLVSNQPGPLDYLDELRDALAQEPWRPRLRAAPAARPAVGAECSPQQLTSWPCANRRRSRPRRCPPYPSFLKPRVRQKARRASTEPRRGTVRQSRPLLSHSSLTGLRRPQAITEPASRRQVVSGRTTANPWSQRAAPRPANGRTRRLYSCSQAGRAWRRASSLGNIRRKAQPSARVRWKRSILPLVRGR